MLKNFLFAAAMVLAPLGANAASVTIDNVTKITDPDATFSEFGFLTSNGLGGFSFLGAPLSPLGPPPSIANDTAALLPTEETGGAIVPMQIQSTAGSLTALYDGNPISPVPGSMNPKFDYFLLEITGIEVFDFSLTSFVAVDPLQFMISQPGIAVTATFTGVTVNTNVIPLPAGVILLISGLGGFAVMRRRA